MSESSSFLSIGDGYAPRSRAGMPNSCSQPSSHNSTRYRQIYNLRPILTVPKMKMKITIILQLKCDNSQFSISQSGKTEILGDIFNSDSTEKTKNEKF